MIHEFTLVLDREPKDTELEALAAAGLDPIGTEGPHPVLAHLSVDAATLPTAIITAVRAIERLGIAVTGIQSTDLVSLKDVAARTGRSYESVRKLAHGQRGPGGFPAPLSTGQWALYSWAEVSAWLARHYPAIAVAVTSYDREVAAADHLIRARHILPAPGARADLAQLLTA
jgi:predicted DNA-binding transcriptional regulator AlpA